MENDIFEIEKILDTSVTQGIRYYFVSWKGYSEQDNTWEPEENLNDCKDVLQTFWKGAKKQKTKKVRKRKCDVSPSPTNGSKKKKRGRKSKAENSVKNDQECVLAENGTKDAEAAVETLNDEAHLTKSVSYESDHGKGNLENVCEKDDETLNLLHTEELSTTEKVPLSVSLLQNISSQEYTDKEKLTRSCENQDNDHVVEVSSDTSCDTDLLVLSICEERHKGLSDKGKDVSEITQGFEDLSQKPILEEAERSTDSGKSDVKIDTILSIRKSSGLNTSDLHDETDISEVQGEHCQDSMQEEDNFELELSASETEDDKKCQEEANSLVVGKTDSPEIDKSNAFIAGDKDVALISCSERTKLDNVESCVLDAVVENQGLVCKQKGTLLNQKTEITPTMETEIPPTLETDLTPSMKTELTPSMETELTPTVETGLTPTVEIGVTPTVEIGVTPTLETELTPTILETGLTPTVETKFTPTLETELTPTVKTKLTPTMETELTPTLETELTPTMETGLTPTVETGVTPTVETGLTPTVETELTPTLDTELTPTVETGLTPTVETELTPTVETGVTPTLETGVTPTVETGVTPTLETEVTPTVKTKLTPTVETGVTPTLETELTPTVETKLTPTMETGLTPTVETGVTPTVETGVTPTVETELTPTVETGLAPTVETGVIPTVETGLTPTVETELTPTVETGLTPTLETGVMPTVKTKLTPTVETGATPTVKTKLTPTVETGLTPTVETGLTPTVETGLTPTVEREFTPTVETGVTPSVETGVTPSVETGVTPTVETGATPTVETGVTPTVETGVTPTVKTGVTPTVETGVTPTVETGLTLTVEREFTPTIETELSSTMETGLTPTMETGLTPTMETGLTPTMETGLTPLETELVLICTLETELTPTTEREFTPTTEREFTLTTETGLPSTLETEIPPTVETDLTPIETGPPPTLETELTPSLETEITPTIEARSPSTLETEMAPTVATDVAPTMIETEVTPTMETGLTPTTMETDVTPTTMETKVTPTTMETEVTPTMETGLTPPMETDVTPTTMETDVTPTMDTELPPTCTIDTEPTPPTTQGLTNHLNEACEMGENNSHEKKMSADKVIKHSKPDTCILRIFNNLQKIKKKIILKPLFFEPKLKTKVSKIEIHPESSSPTNKSDSPETLEKSGVENLTLQSDTCSSLSPVREGCLAPEDFGEPLLPATAQKLSMENMVQTSSGSISPPNIEENKSFLLTKKDNSPKLNIAEENLAKDLDENDLQSLSPAVVDVALDSLERNKLSQLHIVAENLSAEDTEKHCLGGSEKDISERNSPEQKSSLEFQNSCETDHAQTGKQPLVISISDSESTDGDQIKKRKKLKTSTHSKHLSTKGSHHKGKKASRSSTTTASRRKKNSSKKPENEKFNLVSTCDVVSDIINSSSLKTSTYKVDQKQKNQESAGKNGEFERHESDMDICESDFEFDLDDYNPVELINDKPSKLKKDLPTQVGIPLAISLRDVKKAIRRGDSSTILAALAGGLDIESPDVVTGMTLLMRAVSISYDSIVKLLINHGANVNAKDNSGSTPLMLACEQGFESTASLLMDAEADVNAKTINGETALIKACKKGFTDVTTLLLAHGADCQMRSLQSGWTASQWAQHCGHFEIFDLLVAHNKKLQSCVEKAIITCLGHSRSLISPPLLPNVCLYPNEDQKFTYHFNCSNLFVGKTVLLFCFRAVFSRSGEVDLSFSKDNGVHTITLNGALQRPVLKNNRSVFKVHPKQDTNRLVLQTYQSHGHLLVCIYAADLDGDFLKIEHSSVLV